MTAKTNDFSSLLYYNPAAQGFNPVISATVTGPTSIDEGATATFDAVAWGIPDGPVYWWITGLTNITTDRITPGLAAEATILTNRSSFTVEVSANNATAPGPQSYTINFGKVQNIALQSITVTVNDTSQDAAPNAFWNGIYFEPIIEGVEQTIDISYSDWDSSTIYWTIENGTSSGADFNVTSGVFMGLTGSGTAKIHFTPLADLTTEGTQTYYVKVGTTLGGNEIAGTNSGPYNISDTSQTPTNSYNATQSVSNGGSNSVHIDTNPTNDAWAGTVPVGATIQAAGIGTFIVTAVLSPTDPINSSGNWWFRLNTITSFFPAGTALTFIW